MVTWRSPLGRVVSDDGTLGVADINAGDVLYNFNTGSMQLCAQTALGAKVLVSINQAAPVAPTTIVDTTSYTAGSAIVVGDLLVIDATGPNKLVPASFDGAPVVAVAAASAAPNAVVPVILFGRATVKAGGNFAIGTALKTNNAARPTTAAQLNQGAAPAVNGSAVIAYALSAGVAGADVQILFTGGAGILPTNYQ